MKKIMLIMLFFLFPFCVHAETITYDLCKNGCAYDQYDDIITEIGKLDFNKTYDFVIEIKDSNTYYSEKTLDFYGRNGDEIIAGSTITIKGINEIMPVLTSTQEYFPDPNMYYVSYENINFKGHFIHLGYADYDNKDSYLNFKNCKFFAKEISFNHYSNNLENVQVESEKLSFYYVSREANIINSDINIIFDDSSIKEDGYIGGLRFDSDNYTIKNSKIKARRIYDTSYPSSVTIENSSIEGDIDSASGITNYKDVLISGSIQNMGLINYDNVKVNTKNSVGITFYDVSGIMNNVTVASSVYGIEYFTGDFSDNFNLRIYNSDFSNTKYSLFLDTIFTNDGGEAGISTPNYDIPEIFMYKNIPINVLLDNTKISSLITMSSFYTEAGNILVLDNSTLTCDVSRGTDLEKNTIIEKDNGKIIISFENNDVLRLNKDFEVDLSKYFEDLSSDDAILGNWEIGDKNILKIENGKIIPLKVGETVISAFINNSSYTLNIEITEEVISPETSSFINIEIIFLMIICVLFSFIIICKIKTFSY